MFDYTLLAYNKKNCIEFKKEETMSSHVKLLEREQLQRVRRNKWEPCPCISAQEIKDIRAKLKVSQSQFAYLLGVKVATLQNWEQNRTQPEGPAVTLLRVISFNPNVVIEAIYN
jgi:DNA-binding transcriptional regulator YiaG